MKTVKVHIKSAAPVCQSRFHNTPKLDKETPDAHEQRTWKEKAHYDENGVAFVPGRAFKFALAASAKQLGMQVPGRGKKTYKDAFNNGVLILENLSLGFTRETAKGVTVHVNADGVRGSGKRVLRTFPIAHQWGGELVVHIANDMITKEVFETHFREAGRFIGIGQNRPENGGDHGRFDVTKFEWE
jgi:hypothetical protein